MYVLSAGDFCGKNTPLFARCQTWSAISLNKHSDYDYFYRGSRLNYFNAIYFYSLSLPESCSHFDASQRVGVDTFFDSDLLPDNIQFYFLVWSVADPGHLVRGGDFLGGWISWVIFRTWIMMLIFYRHPCVAKVSDYCFPSVYFFIHRCSETTRPILATSRNCLFWCSLHQGYNIKTGLNNPVILKLFWRHRAKIVNYKQNS